MSRPPDPSTAKLTLGLVQMRCSTDPDDNLRRGIAAVREAAGRGATVVCLPELFRTRYFCQVEDPSRFDLAEPIPGPSSEALAAAAKECGVVVVGSLFERRAAGVYHNTAVILDADGALAGLYRKMHIPDDPLYYEKYYFTPGDLGFRAIDTKVGKVGTLVCWDQWYPEAARLTALRGAEVLFYPTAIGWHPAEKAEYGEAQADAWRTMQRAHAIANGLYVAAINRVGHEGPATGGIEFWGGSFVADPFGRVVAQASATDEEILIVPTDPRLSEETRRHWPFLRDRRIDAYGLLTRRFIDDSAGGPGGPGMKLGHDAGRGPAGGNPGHAEGRGLGQEAGDRAGRGVALLLGRPFRLGLGVGFGLVGLGVELGLVGFDLRRGLVARRPTAIQLEHPDLGLELQQLLDNFAIDARAGGRDDRVRIGIAPTAETAADDQLPDLRSIKLDAAEIRLDGDRCVLQDPEDRAFLTQTDRDGHSLFVGGHALAGEGLG